MSSDLVKMASTKQTVFGLVILCVFISLASVKSSLLQKRIVGGSSAVSGRFPYQVLLRSKQKDLSFCGGAIISEQYIVSAAHCFRIYQTHHLFYGVVNFTHTSDVDTRVDFTDLVIYHAYKPSTSIHDLALLRTKESIVFSGLVKPVKLPVPKAIEPGTVALLSGWGITEVSIYRLTRN